MARELASSGQNHKGGYIMMKKMLMIIILIIILTVCVNLVSAATEILPVTSLNASYADGHVSYSGTVTSAVKAVAVLLFDFDGNLIMMDTCEVTGDGAFSGAMEIMLTRSGTYTVKASDYEGGAFTESTFIINIPSSSDNADDVPEDNTDDVPEDNIDDVPEDNTGDIPETGDNSNITLVFVLILLSGAGILATVLNSKRRQYKLEKK
jgi:LPXTG-motif cell wall-anchored protein/prepilin-type processing-associated H-X9-DG protein